MHDLLRQQVTESVLFPNHMIKRIVISALLFVALSSGASLCMAQSPSEKSAVGKSPAMLRAWMLPNNVKDSCAISAQTKKDEKGQALATTSSGASSTNPAYREFDPGSVFIELNTGEKVVADLTANLESAKCYTVIAWHDSGRWELKVFDDGPFPSNTPDRPLRLMNFAQGRQTLLQLENLTETKIPSETIKEFKLPSKLVAFTVKVLAPDGGSPAQSSGVVDFSSTPSAYVVISPDYRGRMRPRVINGGNLPAGGE